MKIKMIVLSMLLISPAMALAQEEESSRLQLSLTRVKLLMETEKMDEALQLVETLKNDYPENPDVIAAEAELYFRMDNRGKGLSLIRQAGTLAPENDDILQRGQEALAGSQNFAAAGMDVRMTGHAIIEHVMRASGQFSLTSPLSVGIILENNHLSATNFQRANGVIETVKEDIQRGEFGVIYNRENGNQAKGSLFLSQGIIGVGADYSWTDLHGVTTFGGAFNRPNWEYIAMVIDEGTQDKLRISRTHMLTPRITLYGEAAINRYGIDDEDNVASSPSFEGDISYTLPVAHTQRVLGQQGFVKLRYGIDAEYPFDVKEKRTAAGVIYEPFALDSYEIHSVQVTIAKKLFNVLSVEAFGGYAIDRLGDDGPLAGASIFYQPNKHIVLEAMASRSIRKEVSSERLDVVVANLRILL